MRFDQHYNESQILLEGLKEEISGREDVMMTVFIQQGPEVLRKQFGLQDENTWKMVFDRLVFSKEVVKKCVVNFMPFFRSLVVENGPMALRRVFEIEAGKYDAVFEQIFDLVAVSDGAIYDYVYLNGGMLASKIKSGKADSLRKDMGMTGARYDRLWGDLLGIMCAEVCAQVETENSFDRGLRAFSLMMNGMREHRSLRSFRKMWEYSEKGE
jgi:hypothetical protein